MPELPEVETIRIQLQSVLPGMKITDVQILSVKSFIGDKKLVIGESITKVRRFAKLIVIDLSNGLSLAVHLKMTGQLIFRIKNYELGIKNKKEELELPNKHTRVIIEFDDGNKIFFNDVRKFGWMRVLSNATMKQCNNVTMKQPLLEELVKPYGQEPLKDLSIEIFKEILGRSNISVKQILMDQRKIAGVGNIYANEALFLAGMSPEAIAKKLTVDQIVSLFNCLIVALKMGLKYGGASDNNYVDGFGQKGTMQEHFRVYKRTGKPCFSCGNIIKRIKLGGRGTFYCPTCQSG